MSRYMYKYIRTVLMMYTLLAYAGVVMAATYVVDQRHKKASDSANGSEAVPFKTVRAAARVVKPGDTILVKNGIYREHVELPSGEKNARITLAAYPKHHPVIKGSEVVAGPWRQAHIVLNHAQELRESIKTAAGGTPALLQDYYDYLAKRDKNPQPVKQEQVDTFAEDNNAPFVGIYVTSYDPYTQMVFVDEKPLQQIGTFKFIGPTNWPNGLVPVQGRTPADMQPGTFFYDAKAHKLYVWPHDFGNPTKRRVEAAVRTCALQIKGYTTVRGFDISQCLMDPDSPGVSGSGIHGFGPEIIIEDCRVTHTDFAGVSVFSDDGIIRDCEIAYNGSVGFTSSNCSRMKFLRNKVHHNNTRHYTGSWHSGGVKVTHYCDSSFIGNYFHDEIGISLWLDISCNNALIADNRFEDCAPLYFEISRWGIIVNNVFRNTTRGIWSYSSDVLIANNVLDRCGEGITITGAIRPASYSMGPTEQSHETLAAVRNNLVVNNIIIDSVGSFIGVWPDDPHCGNNLSDYNVFVWTLPAWHWGQNHIKFMGKWDQYYARLNHWQKERGFDQHSVIVDPVLLDAYSKGLAGLGAFDPASILKDAGFIDREHGDYRLQPDSPLRNKGVSVPMDLRSVYHQGKRPWDKTLVEDAPDPSSANVVFEDGPYKYYRAQPEPAPMFMFDLDKQLTGDPGSNETWTKTGVYPRLVQTTVGMSPE